MCHEKSNSLLKKSAPFKPMLMWIFFLRDSKKSLLSYPCKDLLALHKNTPCKSHSSSATEENYATKQAIIPSVKILLDSNVCEVRTYRRLHTEPTRDEMEAMEPLSTGTSTSYGVLLQEKLGLKDFEWTENEWPTLGYREFSATHDLPVFSLAPVLKAMAEGEMAEGAALQLCEAVVEAAHRWGFFQVSEHGVALELLLRTKQACLHFFDELPLQQKQKGARPPGLPLGYSASNPDYGVNLPWAEILQLQQSPDKINFFADRVWGPASHSPPSFAETLIQYTQALEKLGKVILQMFAIGLGLENEHFSKHFTEGDTTLIRVNRYPPCPNPHKMLGLGQHTDPQSLTLLLQDEVGGLQVLMDDIWVAVKPRPDCFVVNVGDTLEVWSNARLKSGIHRAVVNSTSPRLSMAYFLSPSLETLIKPPNKLVDKNHPRKYNSFTWLEFQSELIKQRRVTGKQSLNRFLIENK